MMSLYVSLVQLCHFHFHVGLFTGFKVAVFIRTLVVRWLFGDPPGCPGSTIFGVDLT